MSEPSQAVHHSNPDINISPTTPPRQGQPFPSLRDHGAKASFPTTQSNQPSPWKEECSEDESFQISHSRLAARATAQFPIRQSPTASIASLRNGQSNHLSGLVSNVHRTTGKEPPGLVGASTIILGDKLYVFGGRRLKSQRPTNALYELDLIRRHWTKIDTLGDGPSPRFFHSLCALGDKKLVCFGGMTEVLPTSNSTVQQSKSNSEVTMMVTSDLYVYDIASRTWTVLPSTQSPLRRYAHCATILPSSAIFSSASAPLSALRHNPPSNVPNKGTLGMAIDGRGGAEMLVVGGQDGKSRFIDTIEVFNFRSLKWKSSTSLNKSYGAYRSVVAPLLNVSPSQIGCSDPVTGRYQGQDQETVLDEEVDTGSEHVSGAPMFIFSNHNFLDTQIELQVRNVDGTITEKHHRGDIKPPGLRFPTGDVINNTLIISGTFITSSQQEYMIWALDINTLVWHRVDVGAGTYSSGSWNRGLLWKKRNAYVILGNRHRRIEVDYNARRVNFSNICIVELEALGLYENPTRATAIHRPLPSIPRPISDGGDTAFNTRNSSQVNASENIGLVGLRAREMCDMEILARDGERIPVNSQILRQRWGSYFQQLFREERARAESLSDSATLNGSTTVASSRNRSSISTVTPSITASFANGSTVGHDVSDPSVKRPPSAMSSSTAIHLNRHNNQSGLSSKHGRVLYLPHTYLTIRALVHYLYTATLPPLDSAFCTPQILCSLLQIARPYRVQGLLEVTVARLHQVLDARNTAAVFNAAAMAAGGGETIRFAGELPPLDESSSLGLFKGKPRWGSASGRDGAASQQTIIEDDSEDGYSSASGSTSSISDIEDSVDEMDVEIWQGQMSVVVGLQKRGLRGLMEGRKMREQGRHEDLSASISHGPGAGGRSIG